jgi:tetratricopeptide (TPR) repeat protein
MSARRRKRRQTGGLNPPGSTARETAALRPAGPPLGRRRRWLLRLAAVILAPALFLILLEAGLRLGGYGYPTGFFVGPDADGVHTTNPQFGWRYFPRPLARKPVPCLLARKPAGAVRIFVLGSSAAQGIPGPSFSVGRILEVLLRERYPNTKFEVVNAAMTASNSFMAREIAGDCAAHQPDLFIVYMGNNEVVGPYGAGTVFQKWSPSLPLIRTSLCLKSTRTGQLLDEAIGWLGSHKSSPKAWQGMEMFVGNQVPADDPRLPAVYANFRRNLTDICRVAKQAGVGVLLSTVAVNLKDCPPFASQHRSGLSLEDLTQWKSLFQAGIELESSQQWPEAIAKYQAAAKIDDHFAELAFRCGRCLVALGRSAEARERFLSACDFDALRFRADSRINAIVRDVAAEQAADGVRFVDAERSLAKSELAVDGIPGNGLFYEHVHFRFDGNYLLARAFLDEVEAALPRLAASGKREPVLSQEQCAEFLALTPYDEHRLAGIMLALTSRPPFTNQLDHAVWQASQEKRTEELHRLATTPQAVQAACETYKAALEKSPDDCDLHYAFGMLALSNGLPQVAREHLEVVRKKWPWDAAACGELGNAAKNCGQLDEAMGYYRKALQIDPKCVTAHYDFANVLSGLGRVDEAITEFRKAIESDPVFVRAYNNLGNTLCQCGRFDEAVAEFRKALELDPSAALAHNNLGNALRRRGQLDEAVVEFQRAVEIDPHFMAARYNLARALGSKGETDEAIAEYEKALKIDPKFVMARNNLGNALMSRGRLGEALAQFRAALETDPNSAPIHNNLGIALIRSRQLDEAILHFQKALQIKPDYEEARGNLAKALKMRNEGSATQ